MIQRFFLLAMVLFGGALIAIAQPFPESQPSRPWDEPLPEMTLARDDGFLRGVALGLYDKRPGATYRQALGEIAELGASTVSLVTTWSQTNIRSADIAPDQEESREDAIVVEAIRDAHEHGLDVLLFPILGVRERAQGEWRGRLAPDDPDAWWAAYEAFIVHYAAIAEAEGVRYYSVGSELGSLEGETARWHHLIDRVRQVYSGQLLYSANWDHYRETTFWDRLDLVGMTGYYELMGSRDELVSLPVLRKHWEPIRDEILRYMDAHQLRFVFTELGYYSQRGTAWHPWDYTRTDPPDLEEQYLCYRAFYEVWKDVPQLEGVFFWHWYGEGGPTDTSYSPRDKPAQSVIEGWFEQWPEPGGEDG